MECNNSWTASLLIPTPDVVAVGGGGHGAAEFGQKASGGSCRSGGPGVAAAPRQPLTLEQPADLEAVRMELGRLWKSPM